MKPSLSEEEKTVLRILGQKNPDDLDDMDKYTRREIGRLSMVIDQGLTSVNRLKEDLEEAEQQLARNVGAYESTAKVYLMYSKSKQMEQIKDSQLQPQDQPISCNVETETSEQLEEQGKDTEENDK